MRIKRTIALTMFLAMIIGILGGCSGGEKAASDTGAAQSESAATAAASNSDDSAAPGAAVSAQEEYTVTYPLSDDYKTVSIWHGTPALGPLVGKVGMDSYDDYEVIKASEEDTHVKLEWHEAATDAVSTMFNLMVASGDFTDIVSGVDTNYAGGFTKAAEDGVIVDMNGEVQQYAPDYWKYIEANDSLISDTKSDGGEIYGLYAIYDEPLIIESYLIRSDFLKKLNKTNPTDFDSAKDVFLAMKTELGIEYPAFMNQTCTFMTQGFNVAEFDVGTSIMPMYHDGDTVKCSFNSDGYKDYLTTLNDWYNEGIIDPNFMEYDDDPFAGDIEKLSAADEIAMFTALSPSMTNYYKAATNPDFALEPTYLSADGTSNHILSATLIFASVSISTQCEDAQAALGWLNYWYTDKGTMMLNYGSEGTDYNIVDGNVEFTDAVINNDLGVDATLFMRTFTIAGTNFGRTIQRRNFCFYEDYQIAAIDYWTKYTDSTMAMPTTLSYSVDESEKIAEVSTDLCTYVSESIPRFITGELSVDTDWDTYIDTLNTMKIQEAITAYQSAYDRYLKR